MAQRGRPRNETPRILGATWLSSKGRYVITTARDTGDHGRSGVTSASQLLWGHMAPGEFVGCATVSGVCWVCGAACGRAMPRDRWMGANFVGQNRVRAPHSDIVCEPCCWATAGRPPNTLRMYTHLLDAGTGEYLRLNKGDKAAMRAWLRGMRVGPWFAAIADSGQKHVVPWAPINPRGTIAGLVLFEEQQVRLPRDWSIVDDCAALLTGGATKDEVSRGHYGARSWSLCGDEIAEFERRYMGARGSSWFALAVWLAQRDEEKVQARLAAERENARGKARRRSAGASGVSNGDGVIGDTPRVSRRRRKPTQALGPDHGQAESGSADDGERPRVDDGNASEPATGGAKQLSLISD